MLRRSATTLGIAGNLSNQDTLVGPRQVLFNSTDIHFLIGATTFRSLQLANLAGCYWAP